MSYESDESEFELPKNEQRVIAKLGDNDFLRLY